MNKKDYIKWTDSTAVYPDANTNNAVEAMYLLLGYNSESMEYNTSSNNADELGDMTWYLARLEKLFGSSDALPRTEDINGAVKKYYRDGVINEGIPGWIHFEWDILMVSLAFSGMTLEELFDGNVEKLTSRKERGKLQGSGDKR